MPQHSNFLWEVKIEVVSRTSIMWGFSGGPSGKEPACQCRGYKRHGFDPWVRKILCRRAWQPTPVFFLENPMDRGAQATVIGSQGVRHD